MSTPEVLRLSDKQIDERALDAIASALWHRTETRPWPGHERHHDGRSRREQDVVPHLDDARLALDALHEAGLTVTTTPVHVDESAIFAYGVIADSGEQSALFDTAEQARAERARWIDGTCVGDFVHVIAYLRSSQEL